MTGAVGDLLPSHDPLHKAVPDGPPRHAHRALHDHDVLFAGTDVCLLVPDVRVAFLCGDKTAGHLDGVRPQREGFLRLLPVVDAPCKSHRDLPPVFLLKGTDRLKDGPYLLLVSGRNVRLPRRRKLFQLFPGEAQVSPCKGAFHNEKVRQPPVLSIPVPEDHTGRFLCGDNGRQRRLCLPSSFPGRLRHISGQVHGKSGTGNDDVRSRLHGSPHVLLIAPAGHHDVKADDPLRREGPCLVKFLLHSAQVCSQGVAVKVRLPESYLGGGDNAHASLAGHGSCQAAQTDAHTHAALDQRKPGLPGSQFQRFYFHINLLHPSEALIPPLGQLLHRHIFIFLQEFLYAL